MISFGRYEILGANIGYVDCHSSQYFCVQEQKESASAEAFREARTKLWACSRVVGQLVFAYEAGNMSGENPERERTPDPWRFTWPPAGKGGTLSTRLVCPSVSERMCVVTEK